MNGTITGWRAGAVLILGLLLAVLLGWSVAVVVVDIVSFVATPPRLSLLGLAGCALILVAALADWRQSRKPSLYYTRDHWGRTS